MDNSNEKHNTCFYYVSQCKKACQNTACRQWVNSKKHRNCVLIGAASGPKTLQEIGDVFGVTRMRICQMEKNILQKIKFSLGQLR
jgi:hypothetical protein